MTTFSFLKNVHVKIVGFRLAKKLFQDRLAPDFSPFQFFVIDEMQLSAILAWLLNPEGSHGQSGRFLNLLLQMLGANWPFDVCERAKVAVEYPVERGRVDIRIESGGRCCVLENKPWAVEQPDQIIRYLDHLDHCRLSKNTLPVSDYPLVYLTPNASLPRSISEQEAKDRMEAGQLHCWAFSSHLLVWLEKCRAACRADRVAVFIDELGQYIRGIFGGAQDVTMQEQLATEIVRFPEMVESAMQVVMAGDSIRQKLMEKLRAEIEVAAGGEGWLVDWSASVYSPRTGFSIDFSPKSECVFRLEFYRSQYRDAAYGAYKRDVASSSDGGAREALFSAGLISDKREESAWPWWRPLSPGDDLLPYDEHWNSSAAPWYAIADGSMARSIIATVIRFRDILKNV
jgi:hypothetical protein